MAEQVSIFDDNPEYDAFTAKFKPKKTTDDCYTPENVYNAVADWVAAEYGVDRSRFVRPFWPGGDFESYDYPEGCVVVDNPPFSIYARICRYYNRRDIDFFLFAPTLTLFSAANTGVTYIPCGVKVTYENGAQVNTSFATNLDRWQVRSAPSLYEAIKRENEKNVRDRHKQHPKYIFPPHVLTAAAAYQYSRLGIEYRLDKSACTFIRKLDAMKSTNKDRGIFGGAFLLADRAAADRAAEITWELSERERDIVRRLDEGRQDMY
jgi:hypothetical protein